MADANTAVVCVGLRDTLSSGLRLPCPQFCITCRFGETYFKEQWDNQPGMNHFKRSYRLAGRLAHILKQKGVKDIQLVNGSRVGTDDRKPCRELDESLLNQVRLGFKYIGVQILDSAAQPMADGRLSCRQIRPGRHDRFSRFWFQGE